MNRKRQEPANVRISDEEYTRLENKHEILRNEFLACRRKLDSKCEALLILSQELDQCRSERDQFKLMAEQLRERYQCMKKQLSGQPMGTSREYKHYTDSQSQTLAKMLFEAKESNKSLQFEHDDLKQKLHDAQGDIKLLREQIARQRVGTTDEGMTTRHFPAAEREELVQRLEASKDQFLQLERDLQTVLDEKEELVTERDVYKNKYERLNTELNYILKGDENRVVDIDALVMENKYLQERTKQMEEEKSMALAAVSKYKGLLEKKKTKSNLKLGQSRGGGMIITHKQVQKVLDSQSTQIPSQQAMSDLQALAGALLDTLNDKNLALTHQRKTNKILGNRVSELEKKIKTLEVAGLWNVPSTVSASLEKLRQECDEVKTLIPRQMSDGSSEVSASEGDKDSELETVTPLDSTDITPDITPECSPTHTARQQGHLELEDLDLLPTKEVSCKPVQHDSLLQPENEFRATNPPQGYLFEGDTDLNAFNQLMAHIEDDVDTELEKSQQDVDKHKTVKADVNTGPKHSKGEGDCQRKDEMAVYSDGENKGLVHSIGEGDCRAKYDLSVYSEVKTTGLVLSKGEGDYHASDNLAVYSEDKTGDSDVIDSEQGSEMDDFISENVRADTAEFYDDVQVKDEGSYCDNEEEGLEDTEASEKIGLLMESVAQKMCNMSRERDQPEASWSGTSQDMNGETLHDGEQARPSSASPTPNSRLLNGISESGEETNGVGDVSDEPHNVEC